MAKPLSNEKEIYEKIKREKIQIHPVIWELINHYIGNDVVAIQFIAGSYVVGDKPQAIPVKDAKRLMEHCDGIREFLKKLKSATTK
jgi:hypothetical protein